MTTIVPFTVCLLFHTQKNETEFTKWEFETKRQFILKILSWFTQRHVVPNPHEMLTSTKHKNCCRQFPIILLHAIKISWIVGCKCICRMQKLHKSIIKVVLTPGMFMRVHERSSNVWMNQNIKNYSESNILNDSVDPVHTTALNDLFMIHDTTHWLNNPVFSHYHE